MITTVKNYQVKENVFSLQESTIVKDEYGDELFAVCFKPFGADGSLVEAVVGYCTKAGNALSAEKYEYEYRYEYDGRMNVLVFRMPKYCWKKMFAGYMNEMLNDVRKYEETGKLAV